MTLIRVLVVMKEEEVEEEEEEEDSTQLWLALMATVTDENNLVKNKQRRQSKLHICLKAQNIKCLNIKKCIIHNFHCCYQYVLSTTLLSCPMFCVYSPSTKL